MVSTRAIGKIRAISATSLSAPVLLLFDHADWHFHGA